MDNPSAYHLETRVRFPIDSTFFFLVKLHSRPCVFTGDIYWDTFMTHHESHKFLHFWTSHRDAQVTQLETGFFFCVGLAQTTHIATTSLKYPRYRRFARPMATISLKYPRYSRVLQKLGYTPFTAFLPTSVCTRARIIRVNPSRLSLSQFTLIPWDCKTWSVPHFHETACASGWRTRFFQSVGSGVSPGNFQKSSAKGTMHLQWIKCPFKMIVI